MSTVAKWFGFGKNAAFDEGIRARDRGDLAEALEQFRISAASEPERSARERAKSSIAAVLGLIARDEISRRDFEGAVKHLEEAAAMRPAFADLQLHLARAYRLNGEPEKARDRISRALDLNPRYGFALLWDALLRAEAGDATGLADQIRLALECDPRLNGKASADALAAAEEGRHLDAAASLLETGPVADSDPNSLAAEADKLTKKRQWHEAEELYRRAAEIAPGYADIRCRYGQTLLELDHVELAIKEFREALTINPDYADAHSMLGVAYRRAGQEEDARLAFAAALRLDPMHPVASQEILFRPL